MSFRFRAAAMGLRLIARFGDGLQVTLRRRHTILSGATGASVLALTAAAAASAGATELVLTAPGLAGRIFAGGVLLPTGHAEPYIVAEDVDAAGATITVTLAQPLATSVAEGAIVVIDPYVILPPYAARLGGTVERETADGALQIAQRLTLGAPADAPSPRVGDLALFGDRVETVLELVPVDSGGGPSRWKLLIGARP